MARKRLLAAERQFCRSPATKEFYQAMEDFFQQGTYPQQLPLRNSGHLHPAFRCRQGEEYRTPLRIVFDASCKTTNGRSLIDTLMTRPKLQADLQEFYSSSASILLPSLPSDVSKYLVRSITAASCAYYGALSQRRPLPSTNSLCPLRLELRALPGLTNRASARGKDEGKDCFPIAARLATYYMFVDDSVVSVPEAEVSQSVFP